MLFQILSTVVAFLVVGIIVSPDTPSWLNWVAYGYLLLMIAIGIFAIHADRIAKFLEQKMDDMNKHGGG